ncbi:Oidioi.mRNA.OKI2018_I69.PAR.g9892.t1.cds [Oikopleura dioica]|uniref:Oidioi.mRNA.OKI2018_I69.PAR.g9892.t1.cds n=1 Tax=Oikopleura dioica TaxID=34765 RepID=A0ABN7RS51_OIKDI|nr:Oidioi.mRNA.OKI2018_I69.PAR.g9892.t1.cds [Oikopleura dioica]
MERLQNNFVFILGGSSGIGRAILEHFGSKLESSTIVFTWRRKSALEKIDFGFVRGGNEVIPVELDLGKEFEVMAELDKWIGSCKRVIFVACAFELGYDQSGVSGLNAARISKYFNTNVSNFVEVFNAINRARGSKDFTVFNLGSSFGYEGPSYAAANWSLQCVGKASRGIFLRAAQQEKGDFRILTLMPGLVKTEMLQEAKDLGMSSHSEEESSPSEIAIRSFQLLFEDTIDEPYSVFTK